MTSTRPTEQVSNVDPDRPSETDRSETQDGRAETQGQPGRRGPIVPPGHRGGQPIAPCREGVAVKVEGLRAFYGKAEQVKGLDLEFRANEVTAIIGPSGSGKSTMIRCINRMHEEIPGARAEGRVMLDDVDVYDPQVDVVAVRRAIGMVFQKPNPFPTISVFDNVAAGLRLSSNGRGAQGRHELQAKGEEAP